MSSTDGHGRSRIPLGSTDSTAGVMPARVSFAVTVRR
jgi:hypothetical protein